MSFSVVWSKEIALLLLWLHWRNEEEKKKAQVMKENTVLLVPSIIYICLSKHVCSSSSTFRAKIHWNVLVLSAVYRKLLNYKMVNKIYFKDHFLCFILKIYVWIPPEVSESNSFINRSRAIDSEYFMCFLSVLFI